MLSLTLIWTHLRLDLKNLRESGYEDFKAAHKSCSNVLYIVFVTIVFLIYVIDTTVLIIEASHEDVIIALSLTAITNVIALLIVWYTGLQLIKEI